MNAVETAELRKDAQLAREIEFAIPRELSPEMGIALAQNFVRAEFVSRGMIADLNVHWDIGADGEPKPHAHVMLTMREVGEDGFGAKVATGTATDLLQHWREAWADYANERLASLDIDARIDHRSWKLRVLSLSRSTRSARQRLGWRRRGWNLNVSTSIARSRDPTARRLLARPALALDAITHNQATFTNRDLAMFVHRHSDGKDQFDEVMGAVKIRARADRAGQRWDAARSGSRRAR